jgi:hypothetical protein
VSLLNTGLVAVPPPYTTPWGAPSLSLSLSLSALPLEPRSLPIQERAVGGVHLLLIYWLESYSGVSCDYARMYVCCIPLLHYVISRTCEIWGPHGGEYLLGWTICNVRHIPQDSNHRISINSSWTGETRHFATRSQVRFAMSRDFFFFF